MNKRWLLLAGLILFAIACLALPSQPVQPPPAGATPIAETRQPDSPQPTAALLASPAATQAPPTPLSPEASAGLVQPADLRYLGAFRLPEGGERPYTFAYGGGAMTFNPQGDPGGAADGFPGSLFISGHDRLAYGELPDGSQVAEVSIPVPLNSKDLGALPRAAFLQEFRDVAAGHFAGLDEIPRLGMQYLDTPLTGPKIHLAWGQHLQEGPVASHAWFGPDLAQPNFQGEWFIGQRSPNSVNGYIFEIPAAWAGQYTGGRPLVTGRFRDGGWSGMGPALFAYQPWQADGSPYPPGAHLEEVPLLLYASSQETVQIENCLAGYQHPDEWEGGAWLTTPAGKTAVLFAGTKSSGAKYWYGWRNPQGPDQPCSEEALVDQFTLCRLADGSACPPEDMRECPGHTSNRGWWSTHFDAQIIFYDPADLGRVALSEIASWQPQPYAVLDIDEFLFLNPAGVEVDNIGAGDQRRYRLGEVAYDRASGLLYILELFADEAQPVVHVWSVR